MRPTILPAGLATLAALALVGCTNDSAGSDAGAHEAVGGARATDAAASAEHEHAGESAVLFEGSGTGFQHLRIVHLESPELLDEVTVLVEIDGAPATIHGHVRAADGIESPTVTGEAAGAGRYHLHMGDLPEGLDVATSKAVVAIAIDGFTDHTLKFALPLGR